MSNEIRYLIEDWKKTLSEEQERSLADKSAIFDDASRMVENIVKKVMDSSGNDAALAKQIIDSMIVEMQKAALNLK